MARVISLGLLSRDAGNFEELLVKSRKDFADEARDAGR
jgi:hypothetical protein